MDQDDRDQFNGDGCMRPIGCRLLGVGSSVYVKQGKEKTTSENCVLLRSGCVRHQPTAAHCTETNVQNIA